MIGILPCAGSASRMGGIPKFLLPCGDNGETLIGRWLKSFDEAGIEPVVLTHPDMVNILSLNVGTKVNVQSVTTLTMAETVLHAKKLAGESDVYIAMPDTYVSDPLASILSSKEHLQQNPGSAVLNLWLIREFQRGKLGQVEIDKNFVTKIVDKDPSCEAPYFWGAVAISSEKWPFIHASDSHLGVAFDRMIDSKVLKSIIMSGEYFDCGTFFEYKKMLLDMSI